MLRFLPLILLCSCVVKHNPKPIDTNFNPSKRDWVEVYREEIKIAIKNDDREAWSFFWREYLLEKANRQVEKYSTQK
jgi:hypothetical protein|tara:strand:- start:2720 stop:2950 length:231 start_codon:yes stop_codon:yes gene_type:complete